MADPYDIETIFKYVKEELGLYGINWYSSETNSNGTTKWSEYSVSAHTIKQKAIRLTIKVSGNNELDYAACVVFNGLKDPSRAQYYLDSFKNSWDKRRDGKITGSNALIGIFENSRNGDFATFYTNYSVAKRIVESFKTLFFNNDIEKIALQ